MEAGKKSFFPVGQPETLFSSFSRSAQTGTMNKLGGVAKSAWCCEAGICRHDTSRNGAFEKRKINHGNNDDKMTIATKKTTHSSQQ